MNETITLDGIEFPVLRQRVTSRGGGIEIDLSPLHPGEKMAAFQNYLGGGLLGCVKVNDTVRLPGKPWLEESEARRLDQIGVLLKAHFHNLTNPDTEWEGMRFEENQNMPESAY